jgi:hypothetical protein
MRHMSVLQMSHLVQSVLWPQPESTILGKHLSLVCCSELGLSRFDISLSTTHTLRFCYLFLFKISMNLLVQEEEDLTFEVHLISYAVTSVGQSSQLPTSVRKKMWTH